MVINVNWTTTAATVTGSVGGLGYVYLNKKKTKKQKAGTLAATTIGTALSALGQEVAKTVVIANADEYVSSLTDEQLAQACELLDGERNISVEEIAQHINDLDTKQVATDVKTKSL